MIRVTQTHQRKTVIKELIRMILWILAILSIFSVWVLKVHAKPICPLSYKGVVIPCLKEIGYPGYLWTHWHVVKRWDCCLDVSEDHCPTLVIGKESRLLDPDKICFDFTNHEEEKVMRYYIENYTGISPVDIAKNMFCEETQKE
jgi:hypothetical protein